MVYEKLELAVNVVVTGATLLGAAGVLAMLKLLCVNVVAVALDLIARSENMRGSVCALAPLLTSCRVVSARFSRTETDVRALTKTCLEAVFCAATQKSGFFAVVALMTRILSPRFAENILECRQIAAHLRRQAVPSGRSTTCSGRRE